MRTDTNSRMNEQPAPRARKSLLAAMEHLVADLMDERGKFLGGLHAKQQGDLSAVGQALGGANPLGIIQLDALRCDKLHQPFAVATHVALHFGERGQLLAFGLGDVEHVHRAESEQGGHGAFGILARLGVVVLGALLADHGSQNENAFSPAFDEAAKRVPRANSGHVAGVGLLSGNQHEDGSGLQLITSGRNNNAFPSFAPDGRRIVYRTCSSPFGASIAFSPLPNKAKRPKPKTICRPSGDHCGPTIPSFRSKMVRAGFPSSMINRRVVLSGFFVTARCSPVRSYAGNTPVA
jgi:hypothetical protein